MELHKSSTTIVEVPVVDIYPDDDFNCRGSIDPLTVIELARDIAEKGLLQPIIIQPMTDELNHPGKKWRIVSGHRRYRAHQVNKAETIPSIVRDDLKEDDARAFNLCENINREELNILQETRALRYFRAAGYTVGMCAKKIGKAHSWVNVRYTLMDLPEDIQKEAAVGMINSTQILRMKTLTPEQQYRLVRDIKEAKLKGNRREILESKSHQKNEKRVRKTGEMFYLQSMIQQAFGQTCTEAKLLGWAAGIVDDVDIHIALRKKALEDGKFYALPTDLNAEAALKGHLV